MLFNSMGIESAGIALELVRRSYTWLCFHHMDSK